MFTRMNPYDPLDPYATLNTFGEAKTESRSASSTTSSAPLSDSDAQKRLKKWNFDANDVSKKTNEWYQSEELQKYNNGRIIDYDSRESLPVIIFSHLGDIAMLKYILGRVKDQKKHLEETDEHGLFPLYVAISRGRPEIEVLETCQFLAAQGDSLEQTLGEDFSCLFRACAFGYSKVALWFLQQGALLIRNEDEDCDG
ncbi:MAG: hypothetical protein SGARI_003638, partial [Bacillariaceae sp.]